MYQIIQEMDIFVKIPFTRMAKSIKAKTKKTEGKVKINRLKVVLAEKDMAHKDLAVMVGKSPNTITRICNNESQPNLKLLLDIAKALDVDIRELLLPSKGK